MNKPDKDEVVVVCVRITTPLYISDNQIGKCSACGWRIQFRPHAPSGRKLCMPCAAGLIESDDEIITTPRMLKDYYDYLNKKRQ